MESAYTRFTIVNVAESDRLVAFRARVFDLEEEHKQKIQD